MFTHIPALCPTSLPAISTLIIAYLPLEDRRIVAFENPTSEKTVRHAVYDSVIQTHDSEIPLEFRTYAGDNPVLPNGTIEFVVKKLGCINEDAAFVDAIKFVPDPGDETESAQRVARQVRSGETQCKYTWAQLAASKETPVKVASSQGDRLVQAVRMHADSRRKKSGPSKGTNS